MVIFKKKSFFNKANIIKSHGMSNKRKYYHNFVGSNFRITNLQATIGYAQLQRYYMILNKKKFIEGFYLKDLINTKNL